MKKTFNLKASNKTDERHLDTIKREVNKYITRERKKKLPEKVDYWDFDCNIGENAESISAIHIAEVISKISALALEDIDSFYLEILVKPGIRKKK